MSLGEGLVKRRGLDMSGVIMRLMLVLNVLFVQSASYLWVYYSQCSESSQHISVSGH